MALENQGAVKAGTACPSVISPSPAPAIDGIESARPAGAAPGESSASPGRNAGKAERMDLDANGVRKGQAGSLPFFPLALAD